MKKHTEYDPEEGRIDLHLHSRNSDGENTVSDVIRMAEEEGTIINFLLHNAVIPAI